jgi:CheY-like chemotaxis protein
LPYDLVLMDMQMPVMDGCTAARLIRETLSAEQLPIVAMTANAMREDRDRCLAAGMNAVVTKPINPEDLWKALLRWVKVREGMGVPPVTSMPLSTVATASSKSLNKSVTTTTPTTDVLINGLRTIAGLDVDQGLARTAHNPGFYAAMLRKFVQSQEDAMLEIERALDAQDFETAERVAHTLKGVAGNLGATRLPQCADQLEMALRTGAPEPQLSHAVEQTQLALEALIQALRAVPGLLQVSIAVDVSTLTDADRQIAGDALMAIKLMLASDDSEAAALWETHAPILRAIVPNAAQIEAAIAGFDFDDALQLLRKGG